MLSYAVGRSGGVTYHYSAWRNARERWKPFRARVHSFLNEWNPSERELVLFGPSAGWTLPHEWLTRFEKITAVEPDPVARWLFAKRFPHRNLEFDGSPRHLPWFANVGDSDRVLAEFIGRHPQAAILFTNVLGQVGGILTLQDDFKKNCQTAFAATLRGRSWASFHDVLSSKSEFRKPWPEDAKSFDPESLARYYFASPEVILDHETTWLSEIGDRKTEFAPWELRPGAHHLIGFVSPK